MSGEFGVGGTGDKHERELSLTVGEHFELFERFSSRVGATGLPNPLAQLPRGARRERRISGGHILNSLDNPVGVLVLEEEPGCAGIDRVENSAVVIECGHHYGLGAISRDCEGSSDGNSVHSWHSHVAEHDIGPQTRDGFGNLVAVRAVTHDINVSGSVEDGSNAGSCHSVVIYDEHSNGQAVVWHCVSLATLPRQPGDYRERPLGCRARLECAADERSPLTHSHEAVPSTR